jgi:hypothetical protein
MLGAVGLDPLAELEDLGVGLGLDALAEQLQQPTELVFRGEDLG